MRQITVMADNKPGVLADIALRLGNLGVNIESITAETMGDGAVVRIVTKDHRTAYETLSKAEYRVLDSAVVLVALQDKPGELGRVSTRLAQAGVNIENIYMLGMRDAHKVFALKVDREEKARAVLGKNVLDAY